MLLGSVAHNVMVWARKWLSAEAPRVARFGVLRLVRDVCGVSGFIENDAAGKVKRIVLNCTAPASACWASALQALLKSHQIKFVLAKT